MWAARRPAVVTSMAMLAMTPLQRIVVTAQPAGRRRASATSAKKAANRASLSEGARRRLEWLQARFKAMAASAAARASPPPV